LLGGRVTYDVSNRWSVGGLFTVLQDTGGARQHAYGVEIGYVLMDNLWATLGYNWRGFSDQDLSGSDYTNRGWVLGLRYKFDEDLFRGKDAAVNKTLTPAGAATP
jgi:opacity protein-like surface antigen